MKNNYEIAYSFAKTKYGDKNSFAERDVLGLLDDVNEIVSISSFTVDGKSKTKRVSSKILKDFCDSYDGSLVLYTSGALTSEYPEEPTEEELQKILDGQERFLLKNGFVSINDYVGYETKRAYIYGNELGKRLLAQIALEKNLEK